MNRTQKGAWFNLFGSLLILLTFGGVGFMLFGVNKFPNKTLMLAVLAVFFLLAGATIYYVRKKQSPKEPESDERDKLIQRNAVIAAFVSVWVLLFIANVSLQLWLGAGGLIPVWSLAIINVVILYIVLGVYSVAILVQYGKGGRSHE